MSETATLQERSLAAVLALAPGARSTEVLMGLDPGELSAAQRMDVLVALTEQLGWIEAARMRLLTAIETADVTELGLSQEEVSLALRVPVRTAQTKLKTARTLIEELPVTLGLLAAGKISARHAEVMWNGPGPYLQAWYQSSRHR